MDKILIIDDDIKLVNNIETYLKDFGFKIESAINGREGLKKVEVFHPDLIVLDLMLPELDGFEVCKEIRKKSSIPILILTARGEESDIVTGLEIGADDYLTKPFSLRELVARIKAILRRGKRVVIQKKIEKGLISLDRVKHKVFVSGKEIPLTHTEFKLLEFIAQRPGIVLTRDKLLDGVFGYDSTIYNRTVDAHIKSLRKKLGKARDYIETVRGVGYRFKETE